ncbi:MAG: hypothetical protein ACT4O4_05345, partial [Nitrospiraceae bacterium]
MMRVGAEYLSVINLKSVNHGHRWRDHTSWLLVAWGLFAAVSVCEAQDLSQRSGEKTTPVPDSPSSMEVGTTNWHYGAYLDVSYIVNFNFPDNDLWRSRSTASHHNKVAPNMALAYVRKDATESSRWGMELGVQGGYDSKEFAF